MADEPRIEDAPPWKPTGFAETRAAKTCSLIVFALLMIYTFLSLRALTCSMPRFESMFAEMGTDLPTLTIFALSIVPILWPLAVLAAVGSAIKEFAVANRSVTLVINGVHLVVLVAIKELTRIALEMALFSPMDPLSG